MSSQACIWVDSFIEKCSGLCLGLKNTEKNEIPFFMAVHMENREKSREMVENSGVGQSSPWGRI